jgi:Transglutaminase-like superfamily
MTVRPIVPGSPYHELVKPIPFAGKAKLVAEILVTYVRVRWLVWRRDLPTVVAALRGEGELTTDLRRQAAGVRLGHAVAKTLALVPFDSRCLVRSLVLTRMLSKRGIASTLVLGVDVDPSFRAHAWVESDGRALLPPFDDANRLVTL